MEDGNYSSTDDEAAVVGAGVLGFGVGASRGDLMIAAGVKVGRTCGIFWFCFCDNTLGQDHVYGTNNTEVRQ